MLNNIANHLNGKFTPKYIKFFNTNIKKILKH